MSEAVKVGQLIKGDAERDAIHIAIAPVTAGEFDLKPGMLIGFSGPGCDVVRHRADGIGIVDPFLGRAPSKGERFYMFLLPNTILSLRHHWTHPAFPFELQPRTDEEFAVEWLKRYALRVRSYDSEHGADYCFQKFMERVAEGEIFYYGDDLHSSHEVHDADELYRNLSIVLGRKVGPDSFEFSCSC